MNIKSRMKNLYFWTGLVAVLFGAAGIDFNTLTDWSLLWSAILGIGNNPVSVMAVILAMLGVFVDTSTEGLKDGSVK